MEIWLVDFDTPCHIPMYAETAMNEPIAFSSLKPSDATAVISLLTVCSATNLSLSKSKHKYGTLDVEKDSVILIPNFSGLISFIFYNLAIFLFMSHADGVWPD